jgi:hypothetical protein
LPLRERVLHVGCDDVDRLERVDANEDPARLVVRDERSGFELVGAQSLGNHVGRIVGALNERASVFIIDARSDGRIEEHVVTAAAARIGPPAGQAREQRVAIGFEQEHGRERQFEAREQRIERSRLRHRPRKAVENERLGALEFVLHHGDDQIVRDELARLHERFGL